MGKTKYGKPFCLLKTVIEKNDYERIKNNFFTEAHNAYVEYAYLDTNKDHREAKLLQKNIRLRIRIKKSGYMLEYVKKFENRVEIARTELSSEDFENLCSDGHVPDGEVKEKLMDSNSLVNFKWVGSTMTWRSKTFFRNGILVLDKTIYVSGKVYYELEFRSDTVTTEEFSQFDLLDTLEIPLNTRKSKLERFWNI
jgi:uncharacterized protein YjbK